MVDGNAMIFEERAKRAPRHVKKVPFQQLLTFRKIIFPKRSEEGQSPTEQNMCGRNKEKVSITPLYFPDTYLCFVTFSLLGLGL